MSLSVPSKLLTEVDEGKPTTEPALKVGTVTGGVTGLLSLIMYFAPDLLTDQQLAAIAIIGAFVVPLITAFLTRGRVWSLSSVQQVVNEAVSKALAEADRLKKSKAPPIVPPAPPSSSGFTTNEF